MVRFRDTDPRPHHEPAAAPPQPVLHVRTEAAEYLVECLPNVGLSGRIIAPEIVVVDLTPGDEIDDVRFELGGYGDRFRIIGFWVGLEGQYPGAGS